VLKNIENVSEYLKSNGIKPSYQRIRIFEYLMHTTAHPTVDTIYRALVPEIPTLSKTTVYNTLNLFVENQITHLISIEENEARYDADTSLHGHFKCLYCQQVFDFEIEADQLRYSGPEGSEVREKHVYYKGLCSGCHEIQ
jgi:Fe2+ or Zn2+ uptake regulation protein